MEYDITVKIPTAGDTSVLIVGIGEIENGSTVRVDAEQARNFKNLTGTTLGRANFMEGITAKAVRKSGSKDDDEDDDPGPVKPAKEPAHPADQPAPVQNVDGEKGGTK